MTGDPFKGPYDLIVIGGGIHGLMTAMTAAERGLRPVLVEKDAMGAATSDGWFAILHGGLRYLQSADLGRFRASVTDRRWFLRNAPDHIAIQPFLLPLYNQGLKRPAVMRAALWADAVLGMDRNRGVAGSVRLARGHVLGAQGVVDAFADVRRDGLTGGAVWHEAVVPDSPALFAHLVDLARARGAVIVPDACVTGLVTDAGAATGVTLAGGQTLRAPVVVNAAGAWAEPLARILDPAYRPGHGLSLAFNLVLNRPPPSQYAVSVAPPGSPRDMLFLYPYGQGQTFAGPQTFAGTWYVPWTDGADGAIPAAGDIAAFLDALNASLPGSDFTADQVTDVKCGLLPTTAPGDTTLLDKPVITHHAGTGGPKGLITQIGVKYTTARAVAAATLQSAGVG